MNHPQKKRFCELVDEALPDESAAPKMYDEMQRLAESSGFNPEDKAIAVLFETISTDEKKHYRAISQVKKIVCSTM